MQNPVYWARRVVARMVVRMAPAEYLLRDAAARLGVSSIGVEGELGHFQGSAFDQAVQGEYMRTRTWAPGVQGLLARLLRGGGTLVDVGANIGLTSIPVSRIPGVACVCFEPDPENYRYLLSNVAANRATSVRTFPFALMSEDGTMKLERSRDNWGDHRIRRLAAAAGSYGEESRLTIDVPVRRLDDVLAREPLVSPVVLKVDTQGAEVQVLRGSPGILPRVDWAILEYWPYGLRRMGDSVATFHDLVSSFPYGAILDEKLASALLSTSEMIASLCERLPDDGECTDHRDVLLGRTPVLP